LYRSSVGCMRPGNGNAGQQMHVSRTQRYTNVLLVGILGDSLSVPANIPLDCVCLFVLDPRNIAKSAIIHHVLLSASIHQVDSFWPTVLQALLWRPSRPFCGGPLGPFVEAL